MKSWKRKLRMGMVGGGQGAFIGSIHRIAASMDQQIEVVAGCFSRDYVNTLDTGRQLYLEPSRCYETFEQMAAEEAKLPDEERIDFVSIVTPNNLHFPVAKTFLEHGFHVVCDKPMTHTLDEARALVKLVEDSGLVFVLTHNYTGYPLVREARHLFSSGEMGDLRKVLVEYLQTFFAFPHEKHGQKQAIWRVDPSQAGLGGTLGDCGTHAINLLEYVTGDEVSEVCCEKNTFLPDRQLDEDANILVRLKGGARGVITVSQIAFGEENNLRLRAYGSKAAIRWEQEDPNKLEVLRMNEPRKTLTRAGGPYLCEHATELQRVPPGHPEGYLEAFANIYCGAAEAIRAHIDGKRMKTEDYDFPTVYAGLRGMQFIYAAVESSENRSVWVPLDQ